MLMYFTTDKVSQYILQAQHQQRQTLTKIDKT